MENKLLSLSLLAVRYTEISQSKSTLVAFFIILLKITLQESCNTGIFYQSKKEHDMKCNESYKCNVRIAKSERKSKFWVGCYFTVLIYFMQMKSLLLALSGGLYKTETSRSTHLSTCYKGHYRVFHYFFLPITYLLPLLPSRGYRENLVFLAMSIPVNKAGPGHGLKSFPVIIHSGGWLACSLVLFWLRPATILPLMPKQAHARGHSLQTFGLQSPSFGIVRFCCVDENHTLSLHPGPVGVLSTDLFSSRR